jgi:anti-sigma regulatory factor (Ser/Thr protein kinase)
MNSDSTAFRHNALVYESQTQYLARAVPFLKAGIEVGEGAVVAHTRPGIAMMREALGPEAARVTFFDVSAAYTQPARTLAAYHEVFVEQLRKTPTLRAVADVQFGRDPDEWEIWMGYEAAFHRCFGHLPAWVLCSYDANGTPDPVIEGVWQTHPEVVVAPDGLTPSDRYEDPDELLRRVTSPPAPLTDLRPITFRSGAEGLRELLAHELAADKMSEAKSVDLMLAATELANNAMQHGGGIQTVRVGHAQGRFVCEIVDRGDGFDDPAAGYLAPREGIGAGLWVARQLTWRIEFFRSPAGFTARMWF